jgi:hypothetical protein
MSPQAGYGVANLSAACQQRQVRLTRLVVPTMALGGASWSREGRQFLIGKTKPSC